MQNDVLDSEQLNKINCHVTLENCKFVKTILMFSVLLYHCVIYWRGNWFGTPKINSELLGIFTNWLGSFHIYAFALVSGYIFSYKICETSGYSSYKSLIKNKAGRLIVPYIFTVIIWVIPIELLMSSYRGDRSFFRSFFLCESPSQLWFLIMLFNVFLIAYPFRKTFLNPVKGFALAVILYGAGLIGNKIFPNVFQIWTSLQYVLFFYIGMQIRIRQVKEKSFTMNKLTWWIWLIAHGSVFIIYLFTLSVEESGILEKLLKTGFMVIYHVIGAISAFVILQKFAEYIPWKKIKFFNILSEFSMPMYLFHQQIIYFVILLLDGRVSPGLNAAANFIISFSVSLIISHILMKFKITRFLIGEK